MTTSPHAANETNGTKRNMVIKKEPKTYSIIGAAMEVHKVLGCGFSERVYQEALEKEFIRQSIPYEREKPLKVNYKGEMLSAEFVPDFVCYDSVIVELKAVEQLEDLHRAQTINYTHVANMNVALLINFGAKLLEYERLYNPKAPQLR